MTWPTPEQEAAVESHPADGVAPADIDSVGGWDAVFPEPDPEDGDGSEYGEDDLDGPGTTDPSVAERPREVPYWYSERLGMAETDPASAREREA